MSKEILVKVINPVLSELEARGIGKVKAAQAMLYAIGLQESKLIHRHQITNSGNPGPARGLWQFEAGGGVNGVLKHAASCDLAAEYARKYVGSTNYYAVWASLKYEDKLAAVFARLLLFTDPKALPEPTLANEQTAWEYYIRNWRPGKPHSQLWPAHWKKALEETGANP